MIRITDAIAIDERELQETFIRASGPGGQNVNKVSSAVQLRFDVAACQSLPPDLKQRLRTLAGRRLSAAGELIIEARRFRTQERNREDALERLVALLRAAAERPRPRKPTKPSAGAKRRRLQAKRERSEIKSNRGRVDSD
jgi:ribosome-associated protein